MQVTLAISCFDMSRPDDNGSEVIENVLKRVTGEEWAVSSYSMMAGTSNSMDTPNEVAVWIQRYEAGYVDRNIKQTIVIDVPDHFIKKNIQKALPPKKEELSHNSIFSTIKTSDDGKKWELKWEFTLS